MFSNWLFMAVSAIMIGLQILIVFVGGQAFPVVPLTGPQWAVSVGFGLLTLAVGALVRCMPSWPFQRVIDAFHDAAQSVTDFFRKGRRLKSRN
jgi:Ca2+-transporting ATPase